MDKLTKLLNEYLRHAHELALLEEHAEISCAHVLCIMAQQPDSSLHRLTSHCRLESEQWRPQLEKLMRDAPKQASNQEGEISFNREFNRVINLVRKQASKAGNTYMSSDIFVQVCLTNEPRIRKLFSKLGLSPTQVEAAATELRAAEHATDDGNEQRNVLALYTIDYTECARTNGFDPVIGRDGEIRRVMQILQRRTKNNPVIIGEPGVGKTAIVEGLAQRIATGEVPAGLRNASLLALDVASLVAGTTMRGEFEQRLKAVVKELVRNRDRYILFIDELHILVGAGSAGGSMDAANILKPALARGDLRCIGATTLDEYRRYIEKDAALERRFQRLLVQEPDEVASISILRGLAECYTLHHGVHITDSALIAAVELSSRYITDRFLPDKAIDLIDEAAAKLRIERDSKPEELDRLDHALSQLKMDEHAVGNDKDPLAANRLKEIKAHIEDTEKEVAELNEIWRKEKTLHERINKNKHRRDELTRQVDALMKQGDYEQASKLKHVDLRQIEDEAVELKQATEQRLLPLEVDEKEIADVVARATGVPVSRLLGTERERLLGMATNLKTRVINQDEAIIAITAAVQRSRTGLAEPNRPNGTFMFLGATGVGKTELAKALAEFLFGDEKHLLRIDMSEYMEAHSMARLIGAPPGYIGHEDGGQLTEAVRRMPYSVVLFDEIEKAHREVHNLFLQVLDDGRLTDSHGRTVDFRNTVLVMTTNVGAQALAAEVTEESRAYAQAQVRKNFSPEFINRFDEIICFNNLNKEQIKGIAVLQLQRLAARMKNDNMHLSWDDKVLTLLVHKGFDSRYGARPLARAVQNEVITPLAKAMLASDYGTGMTAKMSAQAGKFLFMYEQEATHTSTTRLRD